MWRQAQSKDLPELIRFIKEREWEHMHFSSRIFNGGKPKLPGRKHRIFLLRNHRNTIMAALMIWDKNQLCPIFPPEGLAIEALRGLVPLIPLNTLFSLIARKDSTHWLLSVIPVKPVDSISYRLLIHKGPFISQPSGSLRIQQAVPSNLSILYPLELGYQKEEVVRNPALINQSFVKRSFSKQLQRDKILFGRKDGVACTKAGTNAKGFLYYQLGGVYTLPDYRGRGYAYEILNELCCQIEEEHRHICLFVKESNTSARRLYEKAGFQDKGPFSIAYFR